MKVLLVDNSPALRSVVKQCLRALDVDAIVEAADCDTALCCFESQTFDLVMSGWNMPTLDGLSLLRTIRRRDAAIPVLLIVAEAQRTQMVDAIRAGCSDYLVKPFASEALSDKLEKWVGARV
ncbi:MAG: response regulator [Planctomycetaceae bacterium]